MDSEAMNCVLRTAKASIKNIQQFKHVLVVLGNETCDLDSAVSCLVHSFLLHHSVAPDSTVIPVFNISRFHLPVKTEVTYLLKKYGINLDNIICRDEVDLSILQRQGSLQLTLVDHHVLPPCDVSLSASVVAVIDHRPQDPAWPWPEIDLCLRIVGSCCSLVAERLFARAPQLVTPSVATLLLGAILLDTACLSPAVGRATPLDHQMADQLWARCDQPAVDFKQLFCELQAAKADVSTLTTAQLLIKDLKVTEGIPIAGLPMKVKTFLKRGDVGSAMQVFCADQGAEVCLVYGSETNQTSLSRDIAVFTLTNTELALKIVAALTSSKEPSLDLQPQDCSVEGFTLFEQLNIKVTRKQVLPIVRRIGEQLKSR